MALQTFVQEYYLQQNPDVLQAVLQGVFTSAEQHYTLYGEAEGRQPNPYFEPTGYYTQNPDVLAAVQAGVFSSALEHFEMYGATEGRQPGADTFNEATYLADNPDVQAAVDAGTFTSGYQHFVLYGAAEGRASGGSETPTSGETFTLTTAIDNIQGTNGDDTVIGGAGSAAGANTLGAADVINGGGGTDRLNFFSDGTAAVSVTPNMTSVEQVFIQGATTAGGTTVNMVNATGVTEIWNDRSTDTTGVTVTNVQEAAAVGVKGEITGASTYNVGFKDSLAAGNADALSIALDGATITNLDVGGMTAANEFETLNFSATGASVITNLRDTGGAALNATTTVNASGEGSLTVTAALAATVATVDASSNTGGVSFDLSATGNVTATGGTGDDTFYLGNSLTTNDTLEGGEGTDIIGVNAGATLVNNLSVSGFETLDIRGAGGTAAAFDVSKLDGITTLKVGAATVAGNAVTVNNLAKGAGVEINAALGNTLNINVKDAGAGSPNDTIDVLVKGATAITTGSTLDINDIETVTLTADKATATGAVTHTISDLTADEALTINVANGNAGLTITDLNAQSLVLFDASEATQSVSATTAGGTAFTATNGVAFKLGSGNDTLDLTGSTTAGGDFIITGAAGGDAITLTAGGAETEHLVYSGAGESNTGVISGANQFDTIANFVTTEDKIDLSAFGFSGVLTSSLKTGAPADINAATGEIAAGKAENFFGAGGDQRAVVIVDDTADTWVYVDADQNGSFNDGDLAIELTGLTGGTIPVLADFTFA
ncbi:hypothetical protein [Marichromatium sp. AB32]|uniref:beta strand repeat-containing protein n=1 Tax=Marichromatium sp. AB32 TaxID=2483363 RepID=UPI000F3D25C6|nr:hypothetical protein [Marichromatium sp. AB32]RNE92747.1 hypothetical protein EBL85_10445 [Marichromatium sp. AB32]